MAHLVDAGTEEIIFYESHTSPEVLKNKLEACIEEFGYLIFNYEEYAFPAFQWYD